MWLYKDRELTVEDIEGYFGFVYIISNLVNGRKYVGKKLLTKARTRKALKQHKRKRRDRIESDWKTYYGSNKTLCADVEKHGKDKFKREVIRLCKTKGECSYWEAKVQFENDVLLNQDLWYNTWIMVRVHAVHMNKRAV